MTRYFCNACSEDKTKGCKLKIPSSWNPYLPEKCSSGLTDKSFDGNNCPTWVKVKKIKRF